MLAFAPAQCEMSGMKRTGRPTKEESRVLTGDLLGVAAEMFLDRGYRATSIEAVAAEARVAKKTIYAQFGGKAGLFRAVYQSIAERRGKLLPLGDPGPGREGLIRRAEAIVEGAFERHALQFNQLLMREGASFPELQQITAEITEIHISAPLKAYFARELPDASDDRLSFLAEAFINVLLGRYIGLVSQPGISSLRAWYTKERIEALCDLYWHGCRSS
ncbi:putative TetR family transcriptional regulator [Sphingomonas paucimobilis]|nr:TetR/AcrR family transcriptional regulator [Sphingobium quisquiliarum]EZP71073.1 putative TetR family transcriptional regulator [Sphingomonas paucimobilis]